MPREGYKVVTIRKSIYERLKELVEKGEAKSVKALIEKIVEAKLNATTQH